MSLPNGLDPNDPLVKQARRGSKWDHNDQARYDALKAKQQPQPQPKPSNPDEGKVYAGGSKEFAERNYGKNAGKGFESGQPVKAAVMPGRAKAKAKAQSVQNQNVKQDNDINTKIDGNNNYVNNQQDNSIRQYGGDNRQFIYNGSKSKKGSFLDDPVSKATMGGFYDVNDSPAAQAKFVDLYSSLNKDSQKQFQNTDYIAEGTIKAAERTSTINTNALDKRIYDREKYSRAKSDMMGMNLFGDMFKGNAPNWNSPERQTEVEKPDFEKMYDKYTDF